MFKMRKVQLFLVFMVVTVALTAAELPASFYEAMGTMKNENVLCVKNYNAGASITESYTDFESLDKDTVIVSRSGENNSSNALLQASINSLVVGKAQLDWQSVNPYPDIKGRHTVFSRNTENLTGAFSIERFIQLASNISLGGGLEWLPCG
jgi:hypothetical protein